MNNFKATLRQNRFTATLKDGIPIVMGGAQTPWESDIDAGGFSLNNLSLIRGSGGVNAHPSIVMNDASGALRIYAGVPWGTYQSGPIVMQGAPITLQGPAYTDALTVSGDINCSGQILINGVPIGGGGSQTPWTSDIDAAGYGLYNVGDISAGSWPGFQRLRIDGLPLVLNGAGWGSVEIVGDIVLGAWNKETPNITSATENIQITAPQGVGIGGTPQPDSQLIVWGRTQSLGIIVGSGGALIYGNTSFVLGNVGIDNWAPTFKLDIVGDCNITGQYRINGVPLLSNLPSADPGAGSKQLWYDPADGNRVKYSP
jgi:hypothetical protein